MSNTVIQLKHSTETGNVPSGLVNGEIAINTFDGKLFYRDPTGVTQSIQNFPGPAGLNGEIQFNDSGDLGSSANLTFNKTTGNLSSQSVHTRTYIEFGDGTRQFTANAGGGGGAVTSVANATGAVSNTQILDGIKTVDGSGSGLDADTVDGIEGSAIVTTTTITNYSINPRFSTSIGFGNDTEVLYFNDATNQTRSGYWTNKDGFEIRGDSNSKDAVVLQTGNLELTQNAYVTGLLGASRALLFDPVGNPTSVKTLAITNGSYEIGFGARMNAGNYNSLVSANDSVIMFSNNVQGNGSLSIVPWAAATSGIRLSSESNVANVTIAANNTNITGNLVVDTNTLLVDATNNRVGIGTTTPQNPLDVVFNSSSTDLTTGPGNPVSTGMRIANFNTTANTYSYLDLRGNNGDVRLAGINRGSNLSDFAILTDNGSGLIEGMRITSTQNVGIGTTTPSYKLQVNGSFAATTKSFVIPHPTKKGKQLRYGSLEGPENGVYIRGTTTERIIKLPDYWKKLVAEDTITVNLTPVGSYQQLYVEKIEKNKVYIKNHLSKEINCHFTIFAERADVEKLEVEI